MSNRARYLQRTYGLSQATYNKMVAYNANRCYICNNAPKNGKHLSIDHDHKTGEIRGLLCWLCNKQLIGRRRKEHAYLYVEAAIYLYTKWDWGFVPKKRKK